MARVKKNVLTQGLSGKLGKQLVFRQVGERTIVASLPGPWVKPFTEPQQVHHQQFKEAIKYAKSVIADPEKKAGYKAAAINGMSAFNFAVSDYMNLPVILELDLSGYTGEIGSSIRIKAIDNFKVVSVSVSIFKADDTLVETGQAIRSSNGLDWFYTSAYQNTEMKGGKIVATVTDTPGHCVEMMKML